MSRSLWGVLGVAVLLAGCNGDDGFTWPDPLPPREALPFVEGFAVEALPDPYGFPVRVRDAPGGGLLVVEQHGIVWHTADNGTERTPWLDLSAQVSTCHHEQGLLDILPAPDGRVYATYTGADACRSGQAATRGPLVLARLVPEGAGWTQEELLRIPQPYRNHNGGGMAWGPDGMLALGVGDGGSHGDPHGHGQDPHSLLGTVLRLDVSGATGYAVPPDNPFAPDAPREGEGAPEVWLYGVRNPWRLAFAPDGALWFGDVGQDCYEEVNRALLEDAGANLGWNRYEGTHHFLADQACAATRPADPDPAYHWPVHTYGRDGGCSVTSGPFVDLPGVGAGLLFADWCTGILQILQETDGAWNARPLTDTGLMPTSLDLADGDLYVSHWGREGSVHRLVVTG